MINWKENNEQKQTTFSSKANTEALGVESKL